MKKHLTVFAAFTMCTGLAIGQVTSSMNQSNAANNDNNNSWVGILVASGCSTSNMSRGLYAPGPSGTMTSTASNYDQNRNQSQNATDRNTAGTANLNGVDHASVAANNGGSVRSNAANRTSMANDQSRMDGTVNRDQNDAYMQGNVAASQNTTTVAGMGATSAAAMGNPQPVTVGSRTGAGLGTDTQNQNNQYGRSWNNAGTSTGNTGQMTGSNNSGQWDSSCFITPRTTSYVLLLQDGRRVNIDSAGNSRIASQLSSTNRVASSTRIFRAKVTGGLQGDTLTVNDIEF